MMRKFTICLLLYSCFLTSSCEDEAENPPKSSFTVNATSGKANETEFEFVVNEVDADAVTLFPYGKEKAAFGTVLIPKSAFENGKYTVKFKYAQVGVFQAVVVTNNHSNDGSSVKNEVSAAQAITITSGKNALTKFGLEYFVDFKTTLKSTATTPDPITPGADLEVTLPYGVDLKNIKATFETSPFAVVKVGSVVQVSGTTTNNFEATNPITFTVSSQDGSVNTPYKVTAVVTPAEKYQGFKSITGKVVAGAAKDKVIPADADSVNNVIVFYAPVGTNLDNLEEMKVSYTLSGKFASLKYGTDVLKQDGVIKDLTTKEVVVTAQDPNVSVKTYDFKTTIAPTLTLSFDGLIPVVEGTTTDFNIELRALKQTGKEIDTYYDIAPLGGVTVTDIEVNGEPFSNGDSVDYTKPAVFTLTVVDANIGETYLVTYTAALVQL